MLDSTPQSPTPGLSRTHSSSGISTPDRLASKTVPFPTSFISPSRPETSSISATGENGWLDDEEDRGDRARRELSVIDEGERDGSSIKARDDEDEGEDEGDARDTVAQRSEDSRGHSRDATQRSNTDAEQSADSEPDSDLEETGDKTPRLPAGGGTRTDPLMDATAVPTELATDEPGGGSVPVSA